MLKLILGIFEKVVEMKESLNINELFLKFYFI